VIDPQEMEADPTQADRGVLACAERRAALFFKLLDQLRDDDDIELVHDIRVASRRLAEGLAVMKAVIDGDGLATFLIWLRQARSLLAPVRDPDVMRQLLDDLIKAKPALGKRRFSAAFADVLRLQRQYQLVDARFQLAPVEVLARREELAEVLAEGLDRAGGAETVEEAAGRQLLRRVVRRRRAFRRLARRAAKSGRPRRLHAARIAGKKIRYALELAHDARLLDAAQEVKALRGLQDRLGDLNDLNVMKAQIKAFAERAGADERVGMDRVIAQVARRQRRLVKDFVKEWPLVRRRLRKAKARPITV